MENCEYINTTENEKILILKYKLDDPQYQHIKEELTLKLHKPIDEIISSYIQNLSSLDLETRNDRFCQLVKYPRLIREYILRADKIIKGRDQLAKNSDNITFDHNGNIIIEGQTNPYNFSDKEILELKKLEKSRNLQGIELDKIIRIYGQYRNYSISRLNELENNFLQKNNQLQEFIIISNLKYLRKNSQGDELSYLQKSKNLTGINSDKISNMYGYYKDYSIEELDKLEDYFLNDNATEEFIIIRHMKELRDN